MHSAQQRGACKMHRSVTNTDALNLAPTSHHMHIPVVMEVLSNQVPPVQHLPKLLLLTPYQHLL